jgi:twinkle protein
VILLMLKDEMVDHLSEAGVLDRHESRTTCPMCGPDRKKKNEKTLSVKIDGDYAVYMCHHCDRKGSVRLTDSPTAVAKVSPIVEKPVVVSIEQFEKLSEAQLAYLAGRGVSMSTASECGLISGDIWVRKRGSKVPCIGFPYKNLDGSTAVKWRDGAKNFTQTGSARSLWRLDEFTGGDLIITEGEMDAISFAEVGVFATSVPNGAPSTALKNDDTHSKKFSYLWDAKEFIDKADRVIIAGDQDDGPGEILTEEIARRVGKAKCWRMSYPHDCKDANDVLVKYGADALKKMLEDVTPWPIGGLRDATAYKEEALAIYRDGMTRGIDINVGYIKNIYRPSLGTLTICTGVPGSGKSTFLTWLSYELARQEGWSTAVFSAETSSQVHLLQLASLRAGKPFHGPNKMPQGELEEAIAWVADKFVFLDESETSIDSVIERAHAAVLRNGVRILMVDPFNFLTMERPADGDNMQHGINELLVRLKGFAVAHDVAVWLVAHPTKMYRDGQGNTPIPTGYDISGSAHFFNVADSGITLSRDKQKPGISKLTSWKARFSWLGQIGSSEVAFNVKDGSFSTIQEWGSRDDDFDI